MKTKISTHRLATCAMLVAMSVVLRLLGFPQSGTVRFEFGFLPIAVLSEMYGALFGGFSYVFADIIGTLLTGQSPLPSITVCKFLLGVCFGLFFHGKKMSFKNISACMLTSAVLVDLIAMPLALMPLYQSKGFFVIAFQRLLMCCVNVPLRTVSVFLTYKYLGDFIKTHLKKDKNEK